jgi:hypothetical protein
MIIIPVSVCFRDQRQAVADLLPVVLKRSGPSPIRCCPRNSAESLYLFYASLNAEEPDLAVPFQCPVRCHALSTLPAGTTR